MASGCTAARRNICRMRVSSLKLIDISRELLSCPPGSDVMPPQLSRSRSIADGSDYNYSYLSASVHGATHCDACLHFVDKGADITQMPLEHYVDECRVLSVPPGRLVERDDLRGLPDGTVRLLLHGGGTANLSQEAAEHLVHRGIRTVGIDAASVGGARNDTIVHRTLLSNGVAIIENLELSHVQDGRYFLCAAPCKIQGAEASFCRAVLIADFDS